MQKSRVQQLIHGLPNKSRNKEPSMFQILSWQNHGQVCHRNQQYFQRQAILNGNLSQDKHKQEQYVKQQQRNQAFHTVNKLDYNVSPHKYNNQLYLYGDEQQKYKRLIKEATQNIIKDRFSPIRNGSKNVEPTKSKSLNPNNESDHAQIKSRMKKIKNFKMLSRQLPDSAFTTYFGKPAFSHYGSGNQSLDKKSFNIMPHAGKNHPQYVQSYETALVKGKQIRPNYVPKKPLQMYHPDEGQVQKSEYYAIPIKKPNLINAVRFSQDKSYLQRKARTPRHNQLNHIPSRHTLHTNLKLKNPQKQGKKKHKKTTSLKSFQRNDYPLVYNRDNLREILAEKKRHQNRLAYKVTECYPSPYERCQKTGETKVSQWGQMRPAGIKSPRSDHANDFFYTKNIWN